MKTKILLFPLLLLIMIGAMVWFIVPGWKNVQSKKEKLQTRQDVLADLQKKNQSIDSMIKTYEANVEDRNFILEYVADSMGDENIINNAIHYANLQGGENVLRVSRIDISKPEKKAAPAAAQIDPKAVAAAVKDRSAFSEFKISPPAQPTFFQAGIGFSGKYSGIKEFFTNLSKLKRAYTINSFKLAPENKAGSKLIVTDAELTFNFIEKYNPDKVDGSLLADNLDWAIASEARNKLNVEVVKPKTDGQGRENPFLP